jgi:hypothetical protein
VVQIPFGKLRHGAIFLKRKEFLNYHKCTLVKTIHQIDSLFSCYFP